MSDEFVERLKSVGIELDSKKRSGSFLQEDQVVKTVSSFFAGVEVMSIKEALEKYDWLEDYMWRAIDVQDDYTAEVSEEFNGYFIRSLPGAKVEIPVEACLYLKSVKKQKVHNIVIAEDNSELNIISGCVSHPTATGMHIGVSEFFVKKNAKLTFTMIHRWERDIEVRPRSGAVIEENGTFISNYVLMSPVKLVQMYPTAYLRGKNSKAIFSSVIIAREGSVIDSGVRAVLSANKSSAEIISRAISKGGKVISKGHIIGDAPEVKGHLECRGLILNSGIIHAIPELEARYPNVELSHEAAIGKIAEDEIFYLMSRGLTRDEAISTIVRGFLEIEIKGLSDVLKREINRAIQMVERELL